jgi:predicted DNA-binding protein
MRILIKISIEAKIEESQNRISGDHFMKGMTVRIPEHYKPRLAALAKQEGLTPAEFVRRKLIESIEQAERARHRAAMKEMVRQAIIHEEVCDERLEEAALQAIAKQKP